MGVLGKGNRPLIDRSLWGQESNEEQPAPAHEDASSVSEETVPQKVLNLNYLAGIAVISNERGDLFNHVKLSPWGIAVQAYLETGNFEHYLDFNLTGIKCTSGWIRGSIPNSNGRCVQAVTWEEREGKRTTEVAGFRSYDSLFHWLYDHSRLIYRYYPVARDNSDTLFGYFAGLHGKWATDSAYFKKLVNIALQHVDMDFDKDLETCRARGILQAWQIDHIAAGMEGRK